MQNIIMSNWMVWVLAGIAVFFLSVSTVMIRDRWRNAHHSRRGSTSSTLGGCALDAHIATQWTEGRVRLVSHLALMKELRTSLEQDVETLRRLDSSGAEYEREAHRTVEPNLRRFAFDKHLREECRILVRFLQFCGHDLMGSQGWNTTEQLQALEDVYSALGSVHGH
jgi:hypothetical protein